MIDRLPGSTARSAGRRRVRLGGGRLRPESDLDLALLFADDSVPDAFAALELRAALEQRTGRDVDLIVLNRAPTILAFQAAKKGQLIVCRD